MNIDKHFAEICKSEASFDGRIRKQLSTVVEHIIDDCQNEDCFTHINYDPFPSVESVAQIIKKLKEIIYPGYFTSGKLDPTNLNYRMGQTVTDVFDQLSDQISNSIRHHCFRYGQPCSDCHEQAQSKTLQVLAAIPDLRKVLSNDVRAIYKGDPAANGYDEIIFSYPGLLAITIFRIAHLLFELKIPILPRTMTEYAHSITGIDIHPGADIAESFFIDHGTGIVIGETTKIGKNVRIYQGVTLGALSLPEDAGERMKGVKRHPTIEDDVIIYSGSTILGGDTTIGAGAVIGGNVWITKSIKPGTKVLLESPNLIFK